MTVEWMRGQNSQGATTAVSLRGDAEAWMGYYSLPRIVRYATLGAARVVQSPKSVAIYCTIVYTRRRCRWFNYSMYGVMSQVIAPLPLASPFMFVHRRIRGTTDTLRFAPHPM